MYMESSDDSASSTHRVVRTIPGQVRSGLVKPSRKGDFYARIRSVNLADKQTPTSTVMLLCNTRIRSVNLADKQTPTSTVMLLSNTRIRSVNLADKQTPTSTVMLLCNTL